MSKAKLKPCPFCGSEDAYIFPDDAEGQCVWWVCRNCGIEGPTAKTKRAASQRWNDRIGTDINDQIGCLYEIRCILGDKTGKLMQIEVVEDICFQGTSGDLAEINDAEARMTLFTNTKSLVLAQEDLK